MLNTLEMVLISLFTSHLISNSEEIFFTLLLKYIQSVQSLPITFLPAQLSNPPSFHLHYCFVSPPPPSPCSLPPPSLLPPSACFPGRSEDYTAKVQVMSHFTLLEPSNGSLFTQNKGLSPYNSLESSTWSEMPTPTYTISPKSYPIILSIALSSPGIFPPRSLFFVALYLECPSPDTSMAPSLSSETMFKCHIKCLAWAPYYNITPSTIILFTL